MRANKNHRIGKAVFEVLEDRRLMSVVTVASSTLTDGVLTLLGRDTSDNNLSVTSARNQHIRATVDGQTQLFKASDVHSIRIVGGALDDLITVDERLTRPTTILGRNGNDTITGGGGRDSIVGGQGDDVIRGRGARDSINGQWGDDKISGGHGNDTLDGSYGFDTVTGGAGHDDIISGTDAPPAASHQPAPPPAPTPAPEVTDDGGADSNQGAPATSTGDAAGDTQAVIQLFRNSVIAGQGVHVNALRSAIGVGNEETTKFDWNFGDPNGGYNQLTGFNAAHVYDTPGTYTISLTVTDQSGAASTATTTVDVTADTRRTIYVSLDGNDSNSGLSTDAAVRTPERAQELLDNNTRILFRRGDVFDVVGQAVSIGFTHAGFQHDILIGAYGDGADPVLNYIGNESNQIIAMKADLARNVTIQDITFDSKYGPNGNKAGDVPVNAVKMSGQNITVRDCTFLNVGGAINGSTSPDHVLIQDNSAPLATGLRANFVWGTGSDYVILGNHVANSTREHDLRLATLDRVLIAYNDLTNLDRRSVDSADYNKKTIVLQNGTFAYIADNHLSDGPLDVSTGVSPYATTGVEKRGPASRWHDVVVEHNQIDDTWINILPNAANATFHDNVIHGDAPAFQIEGRDPRGASNRVPSDVTITDNTVFGPNFLHATEGAQHVKVTNNLLVSDSGHVVPVKVMDSDLGMFSTISQNIWPSGALNYIDGPSASKLYRNASQWNAFAQVKDDIFHTVTLPVGQYSTTASGVTAGAD